MSKEIEKAFLFIPESHLHCSLDNFDWKSMDKLKVIVDELLSGKRKKGLVLIGNPGCGKSHIMISIFKKLVEEDKEIGSDVMYIEWGKFVQETLSCMKFGVVPENAVHSIVSSCRLLLVDDIRPGQGQIWLCMLKKLIEEVYEQQKVVVLSTNADSVDELVKWWQIEDYWVSRLVERADIVLMRGKDRRIKE